MKFGNRAKGPQLPRSILDAIGGSKSGGGGGRRGRIGAGSGGYGAKRARSGDRDEDLSHRKRPRPYEPSGAKGARPVKFNDSDQDAEDVRLQKLAEKNPNFFKLLQEQNLIKPKVSLAKTAFDEDDAAIDYYERKLGLKKDTSGKIKLSKEFKEDGLLDLLESIDSIGGGSGSGDGSISGNFGSDDDGNQEDDVDDDEMEEDLEDEEDGFEDDDDDNEAEFDEYEEGDEEEEGDGGNGEQDEEEDDDDDDDDVDEEEVDDSFDLEGEELHEENEGDFESKTSQRSPATKSAKMDSSTSSQRKQVKADISTSSALSAPASGAEKKAYVPPHLRKQPASKSEEYIRLQRQIQGHMNRLAESNIEPIFSQIESLFLSHSRHDVTEILIDVILLTVCDRASLLDSFVLVYATLIAALYNAVGSELGAEFVQKTVETFLSNYNDTNQVSPTVKSEPSEEESSRTEVSSKKATNLIVLLAHLYNFEVVSCVLVYDIIRKLIASLKELDIELLLRIIKVSGFQLRNDDPASLKDIIAEIQKAAAAGTNKEQAKSVRFKFMLETIYDLKNNRKAKAKAHGAADDETRAVPLKKFVSNLIKKRKGPGASMEPLRVSLADIQSVQEKGRWWIVGAAWTGRDGNDQTSSATKEALAANSQLMELAKSHRMNTDVRRSIFIVLMSSEDYVDAFEKLTKLQLKEKQEREIGRVVLYCASQEKTYNPYYTLVAEKLCQASHSNKITFQYCLWDVFREMSESSARRMSNIAKFYSHLVLIGALSLSILKVVEFHRLDARSLIFFQLVLTSILCDHSHSDEAVIGAFRRISTLPELRLLREGLLFFFHHVLKQGSFAKDKEMFSKRLKAVKQIISSKNDDAM